MASDPYNPLTRELFSDPVHAAAEPGEPAAGSSVYFALQGVRVRLSGRLEEGLVADLRFRAYGCPHFIAACEWLCREYDGKPVEALGAFKPAQIMQTLDLPVEKTGRILVLEDAVRELGSCLSDAATP